MKKNIYLLSLAFITLLASCSSDNMFDSLEMSNKEDLLVSRAKIDSSLDSNSIIPLQGDSTQMRKVKTQTRALDPSSMLSEELSQLNQMPIYLQVRGNTSSRNFLDVSGEGKEVTVENFNSNNLQQQFYIKILPATTGIPYLIYSKKTNTPLSIGSYASNPNAKVVYAKPASNTSTFGCSWDILRGNYSTESFVIENQDYPRQGSSGQWYDLYYSVITANDAKISLEKYSNLPKQEFSIIPVEDFLVESVTFDTNASTLSNAPTVVFSDKFTNIGPIDQNHTFSITDSYKETSSYTKKTSYNINVTIKAKVEVPFVVDSEISTSVSEGQDFTYGESEEHSFSINRSYPITVPANYIAQMTLTLSKYTMDVEYCAVCVGKTSGKRINIRGMWRGVDVQESNAVLQLTSIAGIRAVNRSIPITKEMMSMRNGFIKVK